MEIVVVLAIMSLVTAMAVPAMRQFDRGDALTDSANDLARILRSARRAALEKAVPVTVTVVPATRAYLVEAATDEMSTILAQGVLELAPGVHLASDRPSARIVFGRLGIADLDSVTVVSDQGSAMVWVDPWTGEVGVRVAGR
jgi:type II secretory pathway pseudopilin PulG